MHNQCIDLKTMIVDSTMLTRISQLRAYFDQR